MAREAFIYNGMNIGTTFGAYNDLAYFAVFEFNFDFKCFHLKTEYTVSSNIAIIFFHNISVGLE